MEDQTEALYNYHTETGHLETAYIEPKGPKKFLIYLYIITVLISQKQYVYFFDEKVVILFYISMAGMAIGLGSHGIRFPGRKSRDWGLGLGLILLGRLRLRQISLGQSRDKDLWNS